MPKRFNERVKRKGLVVRTGYSCWRFWGILQLVDLCAIVVGIRMGVPIVAWPMYSDQPRNAMLVMKELKIGLIVKEWDCKDHEQLVTSLVVEKAMRMLMMAEVGHHMRKRIAEMPAAIRRLVAKGGDTLTELDYFIAHII
ncbi:hypothetical protein ACH5RR_007260 [Cinchona calisaya]|uniref:Uncharacterized protein n=1 Tax=Cinchona calisaya TaxID=153742 RepID=A0ABD3ARF7_9GENT